MERGTKERVYLNAKRIYDGSTKEQKESKDGIELLNYVEKLRREMIEEIKDNRENLIASKMIVCK